jgi:hypothetical protein
LNVSKRPTFVRTTVLSAIFAAGLSACGGGDKAASDTTNADENVATNAGTAAPQASAAAIPTLAQGPDVCFRAIEKHLGKDVKVSEITSFFSAGSDIDSNDSEPQGTLTSCTVQYQNPEDPRKLLGTRMDVATGQFGAPEMIEISVAGGDAASFKLDEYLIPLSAVNAAGLTSTMEAQNARMSGLFGKYAWTGVRLAAPGPFSDTHTLRLDIAGRLASNDVKHSGYASVSLEGKSITKDHLAP